MSESSASRKEFDRRSTTEPRKHRGSAGECAAGVTLALGGGFARGFAHLGVLSVLEEEGVPITAIVGTSIGGLLGAAYADGIPIRELCDLGREVRVRDLLRLQRQSLRGEQARDCISRLVQDRFQAKRIEDLAMPTAIVATDLDTGSPYVFHKGPLEVAVRAACAFPGLLRPVEYEGRCLADGCIAAPVPTEIAARLTGGYVLGVNVSPGSAAAESTALDRLLSLAEERASGLRRPSNEPSWLRHADLLLEPLVQQIDWNDFSQVDRAYLAGVDAMQFALPTLRDMLNRRSHWTPALASATSGKDGRAL